MVTKKILLYFPQETTEKAVVYHLVKDYDLMINIFRAKVTNEEEGYLVLDVSGADENYANGLKFLKENGITVNETQKGVAWKPEVCTHCGNCVPHCPTKALDIPDRLTMEIRFDDEKCIECLNCIENCPYGACESLF